jgi:hypothetical protein
MLPERELSLASLVRRTGRLAVATVQREAMSAARRGTQGGDGHGEVPGKCAEKAGFPGLGFSGRARFALGGARDGSQRKKSHFGGSKVGGWVYDDGKPGAKIKVPANNFGEEQISTGVS